ncbi:MAG: hypothetical protein QM669_15500 [Siphonobacter sp.]
MNALFNPSSNAQTDVFFFDGNLWFGIVDSNERLAELEGCYPTKKFLQAKQYLGLNSTYPCFGFQGEGMSLEEFLNY